MERSNFFCKIFQIFLIFIAFYLKQCSLPCENGNRSRQIHCANGTICSSKTKPHNSESCFHPSCFSSTFTTQTTDQTQMIEDIIYADVLVNVTNSSDFEKSLSKTTEKKKNNVHSNDDLTNTNFYINVVTSSKATELFKNKETDDYDENGDDSKLDLSLVILKSNWNLKKKAEKFVNTTRQNQNTTKSVTIKTTKHSKLIKKVAKNSTKIKKKLISSRSLVNSSTLEEIVNIHADVLITVPHTSKFMLNSTIVQNLKELEISDSPIQNQETRLTTNTTSNNNTAYEQSDYFFDNDIETISKELDEYEWQIGDWTKCSRGCGYGYRSRKVECVSTLNTEIGDDSNCLEMKPNSFEACNTQPCLEWDVTQWSDV